MSDAPKPPAGELVTRSQVATMLGVSTRRVELMHDKGQLGESVRDARGTHHYARATIARIATERALRNDARIKRPHNGQALLHGEFCAQVFRLFNEGRSLGDIVIETRQAPEVIRALYREYSTALGAEPPAPARSQVRVRAAPPRRGPGPERDEHADLMARFEEENEDHHQRWLASRGRVAK